MSEKNLNFDQPVERRGTHSLKYDFAEERGRKKDILPLWVADMDFKTSSFVQEALIRQAEHGIYGYTESDQEYYDGVPLVVPFTCTLTPGILSFRASTT